MKQRIIVLREEDRIHLKSREGMFTVMATTDNTVTISCRRWQALNNHPKFIITEEIEYSDVKCLAGGIHNRRKVEYRYVYGIETKGMLED